MNDLKSAAKLALEALNNATSYGSLTGADWVFKQVDEAIKALEEALAKQEQLCRSDGRCQYAIDSGAEGMGHCPKGKCVMPAKQEQGEPVALKVYRGELCYKSQADDQSFGMWCPVTQDLPFPEGTNFYTTSQPKQEQGEPVAWVDLLKDAEQIVKDKFLYKRFIDGTPLANDIPCWMADFAQQYTTPQQRTWVGLDWGDLPEELVGNLFFKQGARWAEAKLLEKNT